MQEKRFYTAICFALIIFAGTAKVQAQTLEGFLDGLQEVPPDASPGFGTVTATVDNTGAFLIAANAGTYSDMLGGSIAVSLNDAAPGVNGPVIFGLTLDAPGTTTGTFQGGGMLTPAQLADMLAGNTYVNVRSNVFPGGELRGQLTVVPEPAAAIILGLGLLGFLAAARRRLRPA